MQRPRSNKLHPQTRKKQGRDLRRRRRMMRLTIARACAACGLAVRNAPRTWRRWEAGDSPIPGPIHILTRDWGIR